MVDVPGEGDLAGRTGPAVKVRSTPRGDRVHRVHLAPGSPWAVDPLVCVLGAEQGEVPALTLVGLLLPGHDGRVVEPPEAAELGLDGRDQVAALRWLPGSGQVHQVHVDPAHRRRGLAWRLLLTAEAVQACHGWPPLQTTGELTPDGLALVRRVPAAWRGRLPASYELLDADGSSTSGVRLPL